MLSIVKNHTVSQHREVVLKSKRDSPIVPLIGFFLIALFWNATMLTVLTVIILSPGTYEQVICFIIILIPLLLAGFGFIMAVIYHFLSLFHPRPKLIVSLHPVPMGNEVTLRWKMSGNISIIKDFRIYLAGREETTYKRGTHFVTDKENFSLINIFDKENPEDIKEGTGTFTIPFDSMHTFNARNNKISWHIFVDFKLDCWPHIEGYWRDTNQEYEIVVLPENVMRKSLTSKTRRKISGI